MVSLRSGFPLVLLAASCARSSSPPRNADVVLAVAPTVSRPALATTSSCGEPAIAPAPARESAIDLFLADHPREARTALTKVLSGDPRDRAAAVFLAASTKKIATADARGSDAVRGAARIKLAPIALTATVVRPAADSGPKVVLEKASEARNAITDTNEWETANGTTSPKSRALGMAVEALGQERKRATIDHFDHTIEIYERTIVVTASGKEPLVFDATAVVGAGPRAFEIGFAQLVGKTLVVQVAYNGYAKETGGKNGYFAAFDGTTGALAWTSAPLVSNSDESFVSGGSIITGYGFTAEPDFLFVLDLATGAVTQKIPVRSGPDAIRAKAGQLLVRTYDTNYVFGAKGGLPPAAPAALGADAGSTAPSTTPEARCWVRKATAAILAKDANALDEASERLKPLSRDRALDEALRAEATTLRTAGVIDLASAPLVVAPAPPWQQKRAATPGATKAPRLVKIRETAANPTRNTNPAFVATAPFFLAPVQQGVLPPGAWSDVPSAYGTQTLGAVIPDERVREPGPLPKDARSILIYGGRYVALVDDARVAERVFDLAAFARPPKVADSASVNDEDATYAQVRDNVLYVCNGGGSYAKDVFGKKGFLSAIDATTGALLWRSAPLVCNATFTIAGDHLVTGYGFTDEPDFVFVVRRSDGAVVQKVAVPGGPETITRDGAHVHVATYNGEIDLELQP